MALCMHLIVLAHGPGPAQSRQASGLPYSCTHAMIRAGCACNAGPLQQYIHAPQWAHAAWRIARLKAAIARCAAEAAAIQDRKAVLEQELQHAEALQMPVQPPPMLHAHQPALLQPPSPPPASLTWGVSSRLMNSTHWNDAGLRAERDLYGALASMQLSQLPPPPPPPPMAKSAATPAPQQAGAPAPPAAAAQPAGLGPQLDASQHRQHGNGLWLPRAGIMGLGVMATAMSSASSSTDAKGQGPPRSAGYGTAVGTPQQPK